MVVIDDKVDYHPAPWISGNQMENQPAYIWYWMREGPIKIPKSCSELQMRGYETTPLKGIIQNAGTNLTEASDLASLNTIVKYDIV